MSILFSSVYCCSSNSFIIGTAVLNKMVIKIGVCALNLTSKYMILYFPKYTDITGVHRIYFYFQMKILSLVHCIASHIYVQNVNELVIIVLFYC